MRRSILKIFLIVGLPLGIYYLFYGVGLIMNMFGIMGLKMPIVIKGFLGTVITVFGAGLGCLIAVGLWCLAENILESLEGYYKAYKYRRDERRTQRRMDRLSIHDSPLPAVDRQEMPIEVELPFDEDRAYRQRIGVDEEDPDRNREGGGGRINFMG